jgi:hypothetical protein
LEQIYEAHISTQQIKKKKNPRIFEQNEHKERKIGFIEAQKERAQNISSHNKL